MLLSVVIPTCARPAPLAACLERLRPAVQGRDDYEIIVSDDAGDEALREKLARDFPAVQWTAGPRRGPAANRNHGAAQARGEWLVFLDDDCLPDAALLGAYFAAIKSQPELSVFEGAIGPSRAKERMDEECPSNEGGGYLWSCNFAIRRELFARLGGFCEEFPFAAMEDVDLRERLRAAGESFVFLAEARVTHPWRPMARPARVWEVQVTSSRIAFARHPALRPSLFEAGLNEARYGFRQLWLEGPKLKFRGLGRWLEHWLTLATIDLYLAVKR
jgi:GT2 family glycosyltransferase